MFAWTGARRPIINRMIESSAAYDGGATGVMTGIIAGTRVATAMGWRDIAALQEGDEVLTFDAGLQPLKAVKSRPLWSGDGPCPRQFWPLAVPAGAIENAKPMMVTRQQGVMLESDVAETVFGDPFALIPAQALEGVHGIEPVYPTDRIEVITLHFDTDQVIFAEQGALLFCPAMEDLVQLAAQDATNHCQYQMLPEASARVLARGRDTREGCDTCEERLRATLHGGATPGPRAAA